MLSVVTVVCIISTFYPIAVNNIVMSNILLHSHSLVSCASSMYRWIDKIYTAKINLSPLLPFVQFFSFLSFLFLLNSFRSSRNSFEFGSTSPLGLWTIIIYFPMKISKNIGMKIKRRILLMEEGKVRWYRSTINPFVSRTWPRFGSSILLVHMRN